LDQPQPNPRGTSRLEAPFSAKKIDNRYLPSVHWVREKKVCGFARFYLVMASPIRNRWALATAVRKANDFRAVAIGFDGNSSRREFGTLRKLSIGTANDPLFMRT
jgi:hypothetical protein